jgi:hypothetical protein
MRNLMKNRRLGEIITASLLDGFTGAGCSAICADRAHQIC